MKSTNKKILIGLPALIIIAAIFIWLLFFHNNDFYEADQYREIKGEITSLHIANPHGNIRLYPSRDDILRIQIDKFSDSPEGLETMQSNVRQEGKEVGIEMMYQNGGGENLFSDINIKIPKVEKIFAFSEQGSIWIENLEAELKVVSKGKDANTTVFNVKGSVDIAAEAGTVTLEMPDRTPLKSMSNKADTYVTYLGTKPGNASIQGEDGQCILYIDREADATISAKVTGTFTSNLNKEQWLEGTVESKGEPIEVKLGEGTAKIEILQKKGDLVFDQQLPESLLSKPAPEKKTEKPSGDSTGN